MTRDEFMTKARAEVETIFGRHENHIMNLIAQAWAEGKRNAELDEITDIVKKALDRAQQSRPVPDPVIPYPIITCTSVGGNPPEAHYTESEDDGDE